MSQQLRYSSLSSQGGKQENQDYLKELQFDSLYQFIVADGLGGQGGGSIASRKSTEKMLCEQPKVPQAGITADYFFSSEWLTEKFKHAHYHLKKEQARNPQLSHMASTMVVLLVMDGKAIWGHVGDTRLYFFRGGAIHHQTKDHSVPQMLVSSGEIDSSEIRQHPDRNRLLLALGDDTDDIQARVVDPEILEDGDALLLCTDGFWEYVTEQAMLESLHQSSGPGFWLKQMEKNQLLPAVEQERIKQNVVKAENDNYTAIAIWYGGNPDTQKAEAMKNQTNASGWKNQIQEVREDFGTMMKGVKRQFSQWLGINRRKR